MSQKPSALDIAISIMKYSSPFIFAAASISENLVKKADTVIQNGTFEEIELEANKQRISLKMAEYQARVAQEISIARRIDTAEEVMIEEFYDTTGEGGLGVNLKNESLSAGFSASGRQITKRVYTFKGWRDGGLYDIKELMEKM